LIYRAHSICFCTLVAEIMGLSVCFSLTF
jgi:hypothetical protein